MSPEELAESAFWAEYEEADVDRRLEMARKRIEEEPPEEFDGELAFELVEMLSLALRKAGRWVEFEHLLQQIEQRHPVIYEEESAWFELWRLENLVYAGEESTAQFVKLCGLATRFIDSFFRAVEMMRYHGHRAALREGLPIAIEAVEADDNIFGSATGELINTWLDVVVREQLERDPDLRADAPQLLELLQQIPPMPQEAIEDNLALRRRTATEQWSPGSFDGRFEDFVEPLKELVWSFDAVLSRASDWPATRRDQARYAVFELVHKMSQERPRANPYQIKRPKKKKGRSSAPSARATPLMPSVAKLDEVFAQGFNPLFGEAYSGEVLLQALPWWLSHLVHHELIETASAERLWSRVREELFALVLDAVAERKPDPVLEQDLREAYEREALLDLSGPGISTE